MNTKIKFEDLGLMDYQSAWDYQEKLMREIIDLKLQNRQQTAQQETPNYLLFVEHPHV